MHTAFVVLTNECARGCTWCCNRATPPRTGDRLRGASGPALAGLRELGVTRLILSGGEPATVPELPDWLRGARAAAMSTLLLTNGEGLTAAQVAAWRAAGLDAATCSLPSVADAELPTIDGVLDDAQARLRALRGGGLEHATLLACVTRDNLEHIAALIDWADREHAGLLLQPLHLPDGHPEQARTLAGLTGTAWERVDNLLRPWAEANHCGGYYQLWVDLYLDLGATPVSCFMGCETLVVDPDASVSACFHRRDLPCGNLLDDDVRELTMKLFAASDQVFDATCFGRHCLALFTDR
ncbi:MAG TPA: radical SAM protein [bacterium]|nr:radical SAM protein [bacterium]